MIAVYVLAVFGAWALICGIGLGLLFWRELVESDREYRKHVDALREHATQSIPTR